MLKSELTGRMTERDTSIQKLSKTEGKLEILTEQLEVLKARS